jgi:hypothetical protein
VGRARLVLWRGQRPTAGFCEHDNETSDFITGRELLDYMSRTLHHRVIYLVTETCVIFWGRTGSRRIFRDRNSEL